jgi:hypothetical protein
MMNVISAVKRNARKAASLFGVASLCGMLLFSTGPVSAQSFSVDVWTNKGGQGFGVSGGGFAVGEELVVYLTASHDCYASITIGPAYGEPSTFLDAELYGGETVSLVPRQTESDLLGDWAVMIDAMSMVGGEYASDYVLFSVGAGATPPPPAPPPPAPTSPPSTAPAVGPLTVDNATALDSLVALKMADGLLPADLDYDVDGNGQITVDDARLILRWAVQ